MRRQVVGRFAVLAALVTALCCFSACQTALSARTDHEPTQAVQTAPIPEDETAGNGETMFYAHIEDRVLTIRPEDNSSAEALLALLEQGDLTVSMHDYGGFEKVGPLGTTLPTNDERITTEAGDVILYQGNQITLYYDTNSWNFTRLGRVQELTPEQIRDALGDGDPVVVFSLNNLS